MSEAEATTPSAAEGAGDAEATKVEETAAAPAAAPAAGESGDAAEGGKKEDEGAAGEAKPKKKRKRWLPLESNPAVINKVRAWVPYRWVAKSRPPSRCVMWWRLPVHPRARLPDDSVPFRRRPVYG